MKAFLVAALSFNLEKTGLTLVGSNVDLQWIPKMVGAEAKRLKIVYNKIVLVRMSVCWMF